MERLKAHEDLNFINIRKTEKLASKFVEKELEKV